MITLTMNKDEMLAHVSKDNTLCKKTIKRIDKDWETLSSKKSSAYFYHKEYEYYCEESRQKYYLLFAKSPKFHGTFRTRIAEVKDKNRTYYVICPSEHKFQINIISSHCVSRYFERMHLTRSNIKEDLTTFMYANVPNTPIYAEDDKAVLASYNGLSLCEKDKDKRFVIYRTFVTKDLLKPSQQEAFKAISQEMDLQYKVISNCRNREELTLAQMAFCLRTEARKVAEAIYKEYFETD